MKVLVTGAAGFLGSHLMLRHLHAGDTVIGIDNFSSSRCDSEHVNKIDEIAKTNRGRLYAGDICVDNDVRFIVDDFGLTDQNKKIDIIYNFACPASPPMYQSMPIETMLTCVLGTHSVLSLAKREGSVVVHASTSEVYGDPELSPQLESYKGNVNSYGPRACYDEGKRAAEALCYDYLNSKNLDVRVVRIFNTYGPHMDPNDGRVVSNFICQALKGKPLTLYGNGNQTRSFCYVDDLIEGIVRLGALEKNPQGPVNIGNPIEFTVAHLANEVIKKLGGRVVYNDLPIDDPTQRRPDIRKAMTLLNWEPSVQLSEGLDRTIDYFRKVVQ